VKFANRSDIPTLSEKLEHLFKTKLVPLSTKNKSKTPEEDVNNYRNANIGFRNNLR